MKREAVSKGIGNCPVCGFACRTVGIAKTPRHGHIKWGCKWLPPCRGSGMQADNYQKLACERRERKERE